MYVDAVGASCDILYKIWHPAESSENTSKCDSNQKIRFLSFNMEVYEKIFF